MLFDIKDIVMTLHQIARLVDSRLKAPDISEQLRKIADKLNTLIREKE